MQQTTSRRTRSRKRKSSAVLALAVLSGAWGCSPGPELVYVDVGSVKLMQGARPQADGSFRADGYSIQQSIPDLSGQDLMIGSAERRAQEALDVYKKAQEQAAQSVLERLKLAYLEEAKLYEQTEQTALKASYAQWVDSALAELHDLFVAHAEKEEPLRYALVKLVGFPDPDPNSVKVPLPENLAATKRFEAAKAVRAHLEALDKAYDAEVSSRMTEIERRKAQRLGEIAATGTAMRLDAVERARRESEAVAANALAVLEHTALDPEAKLAPVPGASSTVNSGPVSVPPSGQGAAPGETRSDVQAQLQVFLKAYGYRLTTDPRKGRNVTQQFVEWRLKYKVGP